MLYKLIGDTRQEITASSGTHSRAIARAVQHATLPQQHDRSCLDEWWRYLQHRARQQYLINPHHEAARPWPPCCSAAVKLLQTCSDTGPCSPAAALQCACNQLLSSSSHRLPVCQCEPRGRCLIRNSSSILELPDPAQQQQQRSGRGRGSGWLAAGCDVCPRLRCSQLSRARTLELLFPLC